jgi:PPOX class probable FMN-dependent enzyme
MPSITLRQPINSAEELRELIGAPDAPAIKKQIDHLDEHCRRFIALAPLLFISSANADGQCDVSPKGDAPGFVHVLDDNLLAVPERAGNRRTDTMRNVLANPQVGLIFIIPGMRETLRINGRATIYRDPELLATMTFQGKTPLVAMVVEAQEVFLHCGRALVRARVWETATWPDPVALPSAARIFTDHMRLPEVTCERAEEVLEDHYTTHLY